MGTAVQDHHSTIEGHCRTAELASTSYAASLESIEAARQTISKHTHLTQVQTSHALDKIAGKQLFFKCEMYQRGGAFKFRGACNAIFSLTEAEASKGVVTHSSGNHAAALALAAKLRGIPAHIVIPRNTPQAMQCKKDAIGTYGGLAVECEPTMDAREQSCRQIQDRTGAIFVPPYNDPSVISGQGTVGLELLEQVPDLDAIVVPVSGGGLISGISIAATSLNPRIAIIAAEPHGKAPFELAEAIISTVDPTVASSLTSSSNNAADCAASKDAGRVVECPKTQTIADGLQGRLGSLTWPPVRDLVRRVVTVSDQEIVAAMKLIFERMKVVVEPSGAVALAAALSSQIRQTAGWDNFSRIGIVLSGGNLDLAAKGFWQLWTL